MFRGLERRVCVDMSDRHNTIVCCFDPRSPRITAYHIHEWIHECLHIPEDSIRMIQVDGPRRFVYIKFTEEGHMHKVLQDTGGQMEYKHDNGEITQVNIEIAGMGTKKVRIACLPPEVKENEIRICLSKYGEVRNIRDEMWTSGYRYKVYNGIRIADIRLKQHLPSHISIVGNDALISYDGQPQTCYRCNEAGHQRQDCPRGKRRPPPISMHPSHTWADIVSNSTQENITEEPVSQKPLICDSKTKGIDSQHGVFPDQKHLQNTQSAQDGSDVQGTDKKDAGNSKNDNDTTYIEDVNMTNPDDQIGAGSKHGLDIERAEVTGTDAERNSPDNNKPMDADKLIPGTQLGGPRTEMTPLEAMQQTDEMSQLPTNNVRTKKLKTDKEDPASKIRSKSKTRNKNAYR